MTSTRPDRVDGLAVYRGRGAGDSTPVVIVHGSMDRAAAFRKAVRHARELDITLYDRRGYGRSMHAGTAEGMDALVADLLAVIGDRQVAVVGHSLGGVIALVAAQRAPDRIRAVGAFEPPMAWRPWWPTASSRDWARAADGEGGSAAAAEAFMRRIVGDVRWERLPESTRAQRRAEGDALLADLASMRGEQPFRVEQITVPVVVGFGAETSDRHRRAAEELAAEAQAAALVAVPGAAHNAHDTHPEAFADFVRAVVAQAAGANTVGRRS